MTQAHERCRGGNENLAHQGGDDTPGFQKRDLSSTGDTAEAEASGLAQVNGLMSVRVRGTRRRRHNGGKNVPISSTELTSPWCWHSAQAHFIVLLCVCESTCVLCIRVGCGVHSWCVCVHVVCVCCVCVWHVVCVQRLCAILCGACAWCGVW